jgi:hypothetical protein
VKQIRKRLTYANVMSSIAVFLILGGATAFAASNLAKKSVGTPQLKNNAVTTAKIKNNAVTSAKIKGNAVSEAKIQSNAVSEAKIQSNAVTTAKLKNEAVTGEKINKSTLGVVPSATTATNLNGQTSFYVALSFGQSQTIASNGAVSLVAVCDQAAGKDRIRILMQTTQNGAVANGFTDYSGVAAKFLETNTPPEERKFVAIEETTGVTRVSYNIDQGWVLGPESKMLTANSEGIALGLNYAGSNCLAAGVVNAIN